MTLSAAPTRPSRAVVGLAFRQNPRGVPGWVAILVPGAVAGAAVSVATARRAPGTGRLAAGLGAGAIAGLLLARVVDEMHWRRSAVSLEVDEPDAALDLMQAVRAEGVHADMVRGNRTTGAT